MAAIGLLEVEIWIPGSSSLKDKRRVLNSLRDRIIKGNISFAEVGSQDLHARAHLAMITISSERSVAEKRLRNASETIARQSETQVLAETTTWL